jgi:hypothetical protein
MAVRLPTAPCIRQTLTLYDKQHQLWEAMLQGTAWFAGWWTLSASTGFRCALQEESHPELQEDRKALRLLADNLTALPIMGCRKRNSTWPAGCPDSPGQQKTVPAVGFLNSAERWHLATASLTATAAHCEALPTSKR